MSEKTIYGLHNLSLQKSNGCSNSNKCDLNGQILNVVDQAIEACFTQQLTGVALTAYNVCNECDGQPKPAIEGGPEIVPVEGGMD